MVPPGLPPVCPQAAHRHLRHNGLLLVLFTDRDLSSPFVLELEELLEGAVPGETLFLDASLVTGREWGRMTGACIASPLITVVPPSTPPASLQHTASMTPSGTLRSGWPACRAVRRLSRVDAGRPLCRWSMWLLQLCRPVCVAAAVASLPPNRLIKPRQPRHAGGLFRLLDFATFPHTLALPARRLMDSLTSQSALHAALGSSRRRAFHAELQRLVDAHFAPQQAQQLAVVGGDTAPAQVRSSRRSSGSPLAACCPAPCVLVSHLQHQPSCSAACHTSLLLSRLPHQSSCAPSCGSLQVVSSPDTVQGRQWVELPLLTKAYLLAKSPAPAPSQPCGCGSARAAAGTAPFAPEHRCLFCGRAISEE